MPRRDPIGERTELPTPLRLREARRRGHVARSGDLSAALLAIGSLGVLAIVAPWALRALTDLVAAALAGPGDAPTLQERLLPAGPWASVLGAAAVMVLGALWGATVAIGLMFWALLLGGLLAIAIIVVKGGLPDVLRRWSQTLGLLITTRKLQYFAPRTGTAAAGGLPFGVAIGLGVAAYQLWGVPWA